ncbi:hypothetical protein B4Q13_15665, partial [Lacticaseibacillus rhamnosus]
TAGAVGIYVSNHGDRQLDGSPGANEQITAIADAVHQRIYIINDVGSGLTRLAEYWLSRARGLRVEDQPDYAYGKWVARLYQQALSCGEPLLEDVDALVMRVLDVAMAFPFLVLIIVIVALASPVRADDPPTKQEALAWLLERSPNILLIPGTSSVTHLRENISAASLRLPEDVLRTLNGLGAA